MSTVPYASGAVVASEKVQAFLLNFTIWIIETDGPQRLVTAFPGTP
jgi:hypothetical protein